MITTLIHTRNEEENIKDCIQSAKLLSENITVVDMESTDKTVEFAKSMGAEIKTFKYSKYVEPARAFGISQVKTDWVLILDADERMTQELAQEINETLTKNISTLNVGEKNNLISHFRIPRKNIFGKKKWLKHGGWWPDYQIRLFNKRHLKDWPTRIHSTPIFEGSCNYLSNPITHYFHGNLEEMVKKTMIYEEIEADLLFQARRPVNTFIFFRKFFGELFRRLIFKMGFLDGKYGIIESLYQAYSKTITYIFLYEKYENEKKKSRSI